MRTLYASNTRTNQENANHAITTFPFLDNDAAMNLVAWLRSNQSMNNTIDQSEVEILQGIVWN